MKRIDYPAQRVQLLRSLAASIGDELSRSLILGVASDVEKHAKYKLDALVAIKDRMDAQ